MSEAPSAAIGEAPHGGVAGYVEAITADAALGWVWQPGRASRLQVQLRHGTTVVAEAVADAMRPDLAQSGIGDGQHAFKLAIPEMMRQHAAELQVVAVLADGAEVPLDAPPAAAPETARIARLQKSVDMLIASQRLIHRNLQAALLQPSTTGTLAEIAATQAQLRQAIETVELFAVRLEQQAPKSEPTLSPSISNRALATVAALASIALITSACALVRSLMIG